MRQDRISGQRDTRSRAERAHLPRLQHLYRRNADSDRLFQRPSGDPQPRFTVWPYVGRGFEGCTLGRTQSGAGSDDREPDRCRAPLLRYSNHAPRHAGGGTARAGAHQSAE